MLLDVVDDEIDADLPLLAGRVAVYVTTPHGWRVSREGRVRASRGRLSVCFRGDGDIYDSEDITEDEMQYGVPSSAAEARHLAELYDEAEEILAAFRSGDYVPPPALTVYRDNRPRTWMSRMMEKTRAAMARDLNRTTLLGLFDPLEPYSRQERFTNVWRRMRGEEPLPRRERSRGGDKTLIKLTHYD